MTKNTVCRTREFAVSWNAILPTDFRLRHVRLTLQRDPEEVLMG